LFLGGHKKTTSEMVVLKIAIQFAIQSGSFQIHFRASRDELFRCSVSCGCDFDFRQRVVLQFDGRDVLALVFWMPEVFTTFDTRSERFDLAPRARQVVGSERCGSWDVVFVVAAFFN
jgi:hypothetical protein